MQKVEVSPDLSAAQSALKQFAYHQRESAQLPAQVLTFLQQHPVARLNAVSSVVPGGRVFVDVKEAFYENGMVYRRACGENPEKSRPPSVIVLYDETVGVKIHFSYYTGARIEPATDSEKRTYGEYQMFDYADARRHAGLCDALTLLETKLGRPANTDEFLELIGVSVNITTGSTGGMTCEKK